MADVVYLHVGAPKTGTTYIQDRLALNRSHLAQHGVRYPIGLRTDMFLAALDLVDKPWGGLLADAKGEWDALARRVRRVRHRRTPGDRARDARGSPDPRPARPAS